MRKAKLLYLGLALIMCSISVVAQNNDSIRKVKKEIATKMTLGNNYRKGIMVEINYKKALSLYKECAKLGSAEAMNYVGVMYSEGLGVDRNGKIATEWFEKSGKKGYGKAYCNLGELYKYGNGVPLNYVKAMHYYKKAAELDYAIAYYCMGNLYYKGIGVEQSYKKAYEVLKKGAEKGSEAAMYLMALCLRNGYGVQPDTTLARVWLQKSAKMYYQFAKEELLKSKPENSYVSKITKQSKQKVPKTHQKVNSKNKNIEIAGEWKGIIATYDWSGKHLVNEDSLKLTIQVSGKTLTGSWNENNERQITINGIISDTAIYYTQTGYLKSDHYLKDVYWELKSGRFEAIQKNGKTYLAGNMELFLPKYLEPGRPTYVILEPIFKKPNNINDDTISIKKTDILFANNKKIKTSDSLEFTESVIASTNTTVIVDQSIHLITKNENKEEKINKSDSNKIKGTTNISNKNTKQLKSSERNENIENKDTNNNSESIANVSNSVLIIKSTIEEQPNNFDLAERNLFNTYPNPFNDVFNVQYSVNIESDVLFQIFNSNGSIVYTHIFEKMPKGEHTFEINEPIKIGFYILKMTVGSKVYSKIIVKK